MCHAKILRAILLDHTNEGIVMIGGDSEVFSFLVAALTYLQSDSSELG